MVDKSTSDKAPQGAIRVLLVDDEAPFRETLAKVLGRRGFHVGTADCGDAALQELTTSDYDVVVLDLKMPGINGLEVLRRIPAVRSGVRVIMLTGHGSAKVGLDAMAGDAVDYLLKPVVVDELVAIIRTAAESCKRTSP